MESVEGVPVIFQLVVIILLGMSAVFLTFLLFSLANSLLTRYLRWKYKKALKRYLGTKKVLLDVLSFNTRGIPTVVRVGSAGKESEIITLF